MMKYELNRSRSNKDRPWPTTAVILSLLMVLMIAAVLTMPDSNPGVTAASVSTAVLPLTPVGTVPDQTLAPVQTSVLDLSRYFIDPDTTNGTVVTFNTSRGSFNVTLFDKDAPQTVTNFLDYIEAGAYNSDAFHRLSNLSQTVPTQPPPTPYQVLQGGGFGVSADASNNVTGFSTVPTFQPIQNESNDSLHSNVIGTLAMAHGSDPNSATSQFFFNLVDNSQALAASNGKGSTVFGMATNNTGLFVLQNFASNYTPHDETTPTGNSSFFAFPLINGFTPASNFPTGATTSDLAMINSITVVTPPSGALTYSIVNNSNPSVVTATLGSNTLGSPISANQLRLVAGPSLGSSIITLKITDKASETITQQFSVTVDTAPTITGATISRSKGGASANSQIGTVSDDVKPPTALTVTINGSTSASVNGVTVSNLAIDNSGKVTADVVADCTATDASFALQVSNALSTTTAVLNVIVTANTAPTVTYASPQSVALMGSVSVTPLTAADNGSINFVVEDVSPALTTTTTVNSSGIVSFSNAFPAGAHIVTIRATDNCGAFTDSNFTINVAKGEQTIAFGALPDKTFGDADFSVSAIASSGLPVAFGANGNCTVTSPSPGTVHITSAGSCTITASQAGDANYNPATNVPQSFTIAKAPTTTSVSSSSNPSDLNQSVTFTAVVSSVAAKTGTVQFKDNGSNLGIPITLNASGQAQFTTSSLTAGTHTITADYSGDGNFGASTGTLAVGQVVKPQPSLSINDVSTTEGQAGTKVLNFTVTLSTASSLTVTTNFATANGTATAGSDYVAMNGGLTFNPGDTTKTIPVTVNGDTIFEPDETFTVNLTGPTNATISKATGTGTIQNDDAQGGFLSFNQANYSVNENAGVITVTVIRTNDVSQAGAVDYATDDTGASTNCAALNTGLASQRCDYTSVFGTLKYAANETQKTIDIPINLDAYAEGPETFTVKLSNPTGGAVLMSPSSATVTINDSTSPAPNAIDDTTAFVRQQYHDFLNRDADAAGLAFWKNNIDKCNDPAQRPPGQTLAACIEMQRITTSAAFFLSIEFRQTGGVVRDFYVASLNRPLTNNMPGFVEFMRDTQAIQKGVVVGQGNWQQTLDANRLAFMQEFVMRPEFVGLYPTTDTPTQYVNMIYQHAALAPTPGDRAATIAEFGAATTAADPAARARALLDITQDPQFQARELPRGFVQMEYLGYLRRDPNAPPDNSFAGYDFWLNKLIQFNGDFLKAEMVKAFLASLEYRSRFGP